MQINTQELALLVNEATALSLQPSMSKQEEKRYSLLLTSISLVKQGVSLRQIEQDRLNAAEDQMGIRRTTLTDSTPAEVRAKALFMKKMFSGVKDSRELRAEVEGAPMLAQIGTYSSLGHFVPTGFSKEVFATAAQHDALFDADKCTVIYSDDAKPWPIPVFDDLANEAVQINEATTQALGSQVDLGNPGHVVLGAYSYITPVHYFSQELYTDAGDGTSTSAAASAYSLFARFAGDRMARGIGKVLVGGAGTTTTLGLIPALQAAGVSGVVASGSAGNTGGSESGANSIGSADVAALYFSCNAAYRQSPKAAFMCADSTLQYLCKIVDKQGHPIVNLSTGLPMLMGKPVHVSPSVPALGSSNICLLFGDLAYWNTRLVGGYVQTFTETRIEQGLIGLQYVMRADGVLAFNGTAANSPISFLQNHS